MSKELENFIRDHREEMDGYEPGEKVWKGIEKDFKSGKSRKNPLINLFKMRWAAAAVILVLVASFAYLRFSAVKESASPSKLVESEFPPEYAEEVYHFTRLIEIKHKELMKVASEQPELYRQFSGDINKLDSSYQALKKALPNNPNQELLLQAMIDNLKWQTDLLNEQLIIIQKLKTTKKTVNEKSYKST